MKAPRMDTAVQELMKRTRIAVECDHDLQLIAEQLVEALVAEAVGVARRA